MKKLYIELAERIGQYHRCRETNNSLWEEKTKNRIESLVHNFMPHGSGFDSGTTLDIDASSDDRLVFYTSYHHMNDGGYYDGWTEHKIVVAPTFGGFTMKITGKDRNDTKDYMYQVFDYALNMETDDGIHWPRAIGWMFHDVERQLIA